MKHRVISDTSPLVALIDKGDNFHSWVVEVWQTIVPPLLTCEAVIAEACFLLSRVHHGEDAVMGLMKDQVISLPFQLSEEVEAVSQLMKRYSSVPMSLADGCLVRMSELWTGSEVLTIDSDFRIYRQHRNQVIPVIMPEEF